MNTKKEDKKEKIDNKETKVVKKSGYSKKKKTKKNILNGTAFVLSTFSTFGIFIF